MRKSEGERERESRNWNRLKISFHFDIFELHRDSSIFHHLRRPQIALALALGYKCHCVIEQLLILDDVEMPFSWNLHVIVIIECELAVALCLLSSTCKRPSETGRQQCRVLLHIFQTFFRHIFCLAFSVFAALTLDTLFYLILVSVSFLSLLRNNRCQSAFCASHHLSSEF